MFKNLVIIFPQSTLSHRTRLTKLAYAASDMQMKISTWGWERSKGDFNDELNIRFVERKILLAGGGYNSRWTRLYYPAWVIVVFVQLIRHRSRVPVYCLGFETAFPAWIAGKIVGTKYIYDDADRFSMIIRLPAPLKRILRRMEKKVSEGSVINIIPGYERYEFRNNKQYVLKNMPDSNALTKSKLVSVERPDNKLVIYVNGWMAKTRGMPVILELAKELISSNSDVSFIAAGNVDGESARNFVSLSNVNYLGALENHEALAWYRAVDLVFTYYDPSIEINRFAESNKWGDGMLFNIPAIINEEVSTAQYLRDSNACISVPYDDINALVCKIKDMGSDRQVLKNMKKSLREVGSKVRYFDEGIKDILYKVYFD